MLDVQILTLFPELFTPFLSCGLMSRATRDQIVNVSTTHLRDYAINTHGQVDDSPYGGGSGMVLRVESAVAAIEDAKKRNPQAKVVLFSPRGRRLTQPFVRSFTEELQSSGDGLILLCPRYEGVDERVLEWVDLEISLGDFVMMGGEIPAMAFLEGVTRLLPGVLGNPESHVTESFETGLLEYPQYTKPQEYRGRTVPEVLLSGNHQKIVDWRRAQSLEVTRRRRPDLLKGPQHAAGELSVALIHHPVLGKVGETITSSITNIDLHDIARSARTFGIDHFYVVHPVKALRRLAGNICDHWATGFGATYNPNRSEALSLIRLVPDFEDVIIDIESRNGTLPRIVSTSARESETPTTYASFREDLAANQAPHLVLFGTGWGLAPEILDRAQVHLEPINGATGYNHLSVRAAAAIIFDKLLGARQ
ncbi:MAG: tRNA (guanosine(37)-N1)-methyltransferase TrmD [Deltaproteobacteria bacterium]|nr:tRNA (guanosine(37)-N1)-methyltransferase TrmD [Deltaproteobacteria bacterium]